MASALWRRINGGFPDHDVPFEAAGAFAPDQPRPLAMVVAYRGQGFLGWQIQPRGRTVQGVIEHRLGRLCGAPVRVFGAGRTDTGVHAMGQVVSFMAASRLDEAAMLRALGAMLPPDIHVRALGRVSPEFHARFSAVGKTYEYYLKQNARPGMFLDGLCWPLERPLDTAIMAEGLAHCLGEIDMAAFAAHSADVEGSTVRLVGLASLEADDEGMVRIRLGGSGFLRHVVRNLVGTLVQVGQGQLAPAAVAEMIAAGRRLHPGPKAPPGGLYLARVYYRPTDFLRPPV